MLCNETVVQDGDSGFLQELAGSVPTRRFENQIVGLPFAGWAGGVDEWWLLAVERGGLAIGAGGVVVGVEDLHLVEEVDEEAAVATALAGTGYGGGRGKLELGLEVGELISRADATGNAGGLEVAVGHAPAGGVTTRVAPVDEILAVKEHKGVGRCGSELTERCTGRNDRYTGAVTVMDELWCAGNRWSVFLAKVSRGRSGKKERG
jgi:hypothetical protein